MGPANGARGQPTWGNPWHRGSSSSQSFLDFAYEQHLTPLDRALRADDVDAVIPAAERDAFMSRYKLHGARSWDLVLIMEFASLDALRAYQRHPQHVDVMTFNAPFEASLGSIDFTSPAIGADAGHPHC